MSQWSITPVIDWLLHRGRRLAAREDVVRELCERTRAAGAPIERVAFFFYALHPQYFGLALFWDGHEVVVRPGRHGVDATPEYLESPAARIAAGERAIRRHLEQGGEQLDFRLLQDLRDQGMTDYVIVEVLFSDGMRNAVSLATRRAGGFSDHDIAEFERLLHPFAMVMETFSGRELAKTLLETYLGRISGAKVLDGRIKRGDSEEIDSVIWYSDLRDSTRLSEALGGARFLELLNDYFESTAGAVLAHGGEVLRFIGDASLAVFPVGGDAPRTACGRAVQAARSARALAGEANRRRAAAGLPQFRYGIGLHRGQVLYGNIGTSARLEFSVIGAAANAAARIEALCKTSNRDVVLSGAVLEEMGEDWPSLGRFDLAGIAQPVEVFELP